MASKHRQGSIKRFGARYGRGVKLKFGTVEAEQRRNHLCPYCRAVRVRRVAAGIWECRKCGSKFTGRAYTVGMPRVRTQTQIGSEPEEAPKAPAEGETPAEADAGTQAGGGEAEEMPGHEAEEESDSEDGDS